MALTAKLLSGPAAPGTTDGTLYTVPASTTTIIKEIIVTNTTGAAANISIALNGTAATVGNCIVSTYSVPGQGAGNVSTVVFALSTVLATGGTIHALQGTSAALTVTISGVEIV